MTSEAEIATWNRRTARGDLVLIDSLTEVAIVNGWAQVVQGSAVVELCGLGRWPVGDLLPIRGRDLRYLQTFVRCDHCGAAPRRLREPRRSAGTHAAPVSAGGPHRPARERAP